MRYIILSLTVGLLISCADSGNTSEKVKLMTLNPGHFHAALVHKKMYPQVDSTIYLYAPEGPEAESFVSKINSYNTGGEPTTSWTIEDRLSDDYLDQMINEKPGNVMIVAGKNSKKIDYVLAAVSAGINVYADKPLVIDKAGYDKLQKAFLIAEENNVMIYDIMTERFESTTMMQKLFSTLPDVFGQIIDGDEGSPAISKESVHHFYKYVSGAPLVRPAWFFDVDEEGEGLVDVTTHLVDLVQWELFPEEVIDINQIKMLSAKRWPTILTKEQFTKVTGLQGFPEYLQEDIIDGKLHVYCNGEMNYIINGKHAKVSVLWDFQAPAGTGDTHYSIMRGTLSDLIIRQGEAEGYRPVLYVQPKSAAGFTEIIQAAVNEEVQNLFPGTTVESVGGGLWKINIPEKFKIGHEAHFGQVTENYLKYLEEGALPTWEVPNMKSKYYTTTEAFKMAKMNAK